ncbi:MOSC domain-containing protein [Elsinoe ampelina]|uniref:MOSC domain-containing protein n=1 Tax=Elsinoe ampelina TaxID=302913 RepID=A0A6A6GAH7_9PEZI|nr:MOSC domain-containing protein [Elsinoe ampelina]
MPSIDLSPIQVPAPTILEDVRTSRMKPFGTVFSGIDKQSRTGPLMVTSLGLPDDEHDPTFHGGIDKAMHQYCSSHYAFWQSQYHGTDAVHRFVPGGFGENLVASGFHEENVCIGDLVRIAPQGTPLDVNTQTSILEVSLPRQPCFKLNQRFGIKNFAPKTHQNSKTGWYYRVKIEGRIEAGMEMRVIHRANPRWSIARIHHYVHRDRKDMEVVQELMALKGLGDECRDVFRNRWTGHPESRNPRAAEEWTRSTVVSKRKETSRVVAIQLQAQDAADGPLKIPAGSYALIRLGSGLQRDYSVVSGTKALFTLGVALDDNSRGGSAYIHEKLKVGDTVEVGSIKRSISPSGMASHSIFIVGGIGITAFLAMMKKLLAINQTVELHYAVRSPDDVAFRSQVEDLGPNVRIYSKSEGQRMDIDEVLTTRKWNSHVFTCGPQRMIDAVIAGARAAGMADDEVHFESFTANTSGDPFSVEVLDKGRSIPVKVEANKSLLETMREAGFDVPSSCEVGSCGACRLKVVEGRVDHRGIGLTTDEKNGEMLSCVSRGIGHVVVESPKV